MHDEVVCQLAKDLSQLTRALEKSECLTDESPLLLVDELPSTLVYTRHLRCSATGCLAEPIDAYTKVLVQDISYDTDTDCPWPPAPEATSDSSGSDANELFPEMPSAACTAADGIGVAVTAAGTAPRGAGSQSPVPPGVPRATANAAGTCVLFPCQTRLMTADAAAVQQAVASGKDLASVSRNLTAAFAGAGTAAAARAMHLLHQTPPLAKAAEPGALSAATAAAALILAAGRSDAATAARGGEVPWIGVSAPAIHACLQSSVTPLACLLDLAELAGRLSARVVLLHVSKTLNDRLSDTVCYSLPNSASTWDAISRWLQRPLRALQKRSAPKSGRPGGGCLGPVATVARTLAAIHGDGSGRDVASALANARDAIAAAAAAADGNLVSALSDAVFGAVAELDPWALFDCLTMQTAPAHTAATSAAFARCAEWLHSVYPEIVFPERLAGYGLAGSALDVPALRPPPIDHLSWQASDQLQRVYAEHALPPPLVCYCLCVRTVPVTAAVVLLADPVSRRRLNLERPAPVIAPRQKRFLRVTAPRRLVFSQPRLHHGACIGAASVVPPPGGAHGQPEAFAHAAWPRAPAWPGNEHLAHAPHAAPGDRHMPSGGCHFHPDAAAHAPPAPQCFQPASSRPSDERWGEFPGGQAAHSFPMAGSLGSVPTAALACSPSDCLQTWLLHAHAEALGPPLTGVFIDLR